MILHPMLSTLFKALLSLRYNVSITGLEQLSGVKGVLVLPNHPAEIDPVIITTYLWDLLRPRPVVLEKFYHLPQVRPAMRIARAIPMPDMEFDSGPYKRRRIEKALDEVVATLKKGDSILIYPSGRLSVSGEEKIGAASGVYSILQRYPDVPVAVIRIRGLFGSIFSKAVTGGIAPDLLSTAKRALGILAKNLVFGCPKREVTIEITLNPPGFPREGDALTINRYLEQHYNSPTKESPILISHSRWKEEIPLLPEQNSDVGSLSNIPPEIERKVVFYLSQLSKVPVDNLKPDRQLGEHLGLDSLTIAEILLWLDQECEVADVELAELTTVGAVLRAAAGQLSSGHPKQSFQVSNSWFNNVSTRPTPELSAVKTVPEAFLAAAARFGDSPAMGDERSGILSWSRVRLGALLLARHIATLEGQHIGILFPASAGGSIASMATMLARRVPVFLNWTAGKRSIEHAVATTEIKKILTSRAFLDIVPVDLEFIEDRFVFVEDIKKSATLWDKLAVKRLANESCQQLGEAFGLSSINPDDQAVVLFTSGSESLPKGVPLSHRNILSNITGVLQAFQLKNEDVLLGFLPPFHSFGLTICTILPLVTGLRVAYHPNPNESRKLARAIQKWGVTLAAGTPTFLRSILKAGDVEQFKTIRFLVSGAEKAPAELFEQVAALGEGKSLIEGYGITECSPVVTVGRPGQGSHGVGRPVSSVQILIIHPETQEPLPEGEQGLILIRGTSVFSGYIGVDNNPFMEKQKQLWYNSGDLGFLTDGSLVITGRLKRFIKIGGEMVSLGAIEETLLPHAPSEDGAPTVAVMSKGVEGSERPVLTLFTTAPLEVERTNEILHQAGFPHLVRISAVKQLESIPVLGTGKTDYQALREA
jgi:long-chain-fatty-acid--[acyl-carrier-protein] ligase